MSELADNARRLLADAELVFERGSHQTAASLAILALEEVGKFFQVKWDAGDGKPVNLPMRGPKAHQSKQATVGSFYAAEAAIAGMKEFLRGMGYPDDDRTVSQFATALHMPDEKAQEALEKVVAFVAAKMADDEKTRLMRFARMGLVDRIKQQGLYVDIDKDGELLSSPTSITREIAIEWMEHACQAVMRLPSKF